MAVIVVLCHLVGAPYTYALGTMVVQLKGDAPTSTVNANGTWLTADATLQQFINKQEGSAPASGGLGIVHQALPTTDSGKGSWGKRFSMFISVAGSSDTTQGSARTVGGSLLPATVMGHRPALFMDYLIFKPQGSKEGSVLNGWRSYAGIARNTWGVDSATTRVFSEVVILSGGLRRVFVPINVSSGENNFSVTFEGGVTGRYIYFDDENGPSVRRLGLGGEKRALAFELGVAFQFKDFAASMYLPMFNKDKRDSDIVGLTGAHPQFQFTVQPKFYRIADK